MADLLAVVSLAVSVAALAHQFWIAHNAPRSKRRRRTVRRKARRRIDLGFYKSDVTETIEQDDRF